MAGKKKLKTQIQKLISPWLLEGFSSFLQKRYEKGLIYHVLVFGLRGNVFQFCLQETSNPSFFLKINNLLSRKLFQSS